MAKKRSRSKSRSSRSNPGVKYSLLFALVLILLAFLLLFAKAPDGTEDVTGEYVLGDDRYIVETDVGSLLVQADRSAIATDERTAAESMVTCLDNDVHMGADRFFLPSSAHLENLWTGQRLEQSRVAYDSCHRNKYLAEAKCDNGVVAYETVRCRNLLGPAAFCEEIALDDGGMAGRCAV